MILRIGHGRTALAKALLRRDAGDLLEVEPEVQRHAVAAVERA